MNNIIYADMREISSVEEKEILVRNALAEIGYARRRNDHLFDKNGRISKRSKLEAIMAATCSYVRNEWKYWVIAIVVIFAWAFANAAQAAPEVKAQAEGVKIVKDLDQKKWYTLYDGHSAELHEAFDEVSIRWSGRLQGNPLLLISGRQGTKCDTFFRLLWLKPKGEFEMIKDFPGYCSVSAEVFPGFPITRVVLDGQSFLIDFEDNEDGQKQAKQ